MSLSPQEVAYETAHLNETKQPAIYGVTITFYIIAMASVMARLIARRGQETRLYLDDYLIFLAVLPSISLFAATLGATANGMGRHIIALSTDELILSAKWEVVNLYSYVTFISLVKLSILSFLHRVFGSSNKLFRIFVWILAVWVLCWAVALYFAFGFQCQPFYRNWSLTNPCRVKLDLQYSASILNAVHDVILFTAPQVVIWKLQLDTTKKIHVSIIFAIGFIATLFGILKIIYVEGAPGSTHKSDPTYTTVPAVIFNFLEPTLAITCACLPSTPALVRWARDGRFATLFSGTAISLKSLRSRHGKSSAQPKTLKSGRDTVQAHENSSAEEKIYAHTQVTVETSRAAADDIPKSRNPAEWQVDPRSRV